MTPNLTGRAARIEEILRTLAPTRFEIVNDSVHHQGHAGDNGSGESHFTIRMTSPRFAGMPRVAQHRLVMDLLRPELESGLHAVTLDLRAP